MTQLPPSFDLLYDLKTLEQLHDHLTGRRRSPVNGTDAEVMLLCVESDVPLPPELQSAQARLPSLLVSIGEIDNLADLARAQKRLDEAQGAFYKKNIEPQLQQCRTRKSALDIYMAIQDRLEDEHGQRLPMPKLIERRLDENLARFPTRAESEQKIVTKPEDDSPSP